MGIIRALTWCPAARWDPVGKHLSHQESSEVRHLCSFKDEVLGSPRAGFTIFLLSLGLWQHFLSLLHRGALLLGVAQCVAGTRGDGVGLAAAV